MKLLVWSRKVDSFFFSALFYILSYIFLIYGSDKLISSFKTPSILSPSFNLMLFYLANTLASYAFFSSSSFNFSCLERILGASGLAAASFAIILYLQASISILIFLTFSANIFCLSSQVSFFGFSGYTYTWLILDLESLSSELKDLRESINLVLDSFKSMSDLTSNYWYILLFGLSYLLFFLSVKYYVLSSEGNF